MKTTYILMGTLILLPALDLIIHKKRLPLIKTIIGFLFAIIGLFFLLIEKLVPYTLLYEIASLLLIVYFSLTFVPKKITKNLTEYDYFELEKNYNEIKEEHTKLRERYLSTVSIMDEGVVFYENGMKDVILSDKAHELFKGKSFSNLETHSLSIDARDRNEYLKTIGRISRRTPTYDIKYRIIGEKNLIWVQEKGSFIDVGEKKSIIATIRPLEVSVFKETNYIDIDTLSGFDKLLPSISALMKAHHQFSLCLFELTNIPEMNEKYGRDVGTIMISDYIKFMKKAYVPDISRIFRVTGIRFAVIIEDEKIYDELKKALSSPGSTIYNMKIQVAGIKDYVKPNFGIVNYSGSKLFSSDDLLRLSNKTLEEAKESTRRSYSIFGE